MFPVQVCFWSYVCSLVTGCSMHIPYLSFDYLYQQRGEPKFSSVLAQRSVAISIVQRKKKEKKVAKINHRTRAALEPRSAVLHNFRPRSSGTPFSRRAVSMREFCRATEASSLFTWTNQDDLDKNINKRGMLLIRCKILLVLINNFTDFKMKENLLLFSMLSPCISDTHTISITHMQSPFYILKLVRSEKILISFYML